MRKIFGGIVIVVFSIGLIVSMALIANQRQQAQLEKESVTYANLRIAKQSSTETSDLKTPSNGLKRVGQGKKLTYVAMGDDIAAGHYTSTEKAAYPYLVAAYLQKQLDFKVTMKSVWESGATIGTSGLSNINTVVNNKPDIITIQYGNNEQTSPGITANLYRTNLNQAIKQLQARLPKVRIILVTPWNQNSSFKKAVVSVSKLTGTKVVDISAIQTAKDTNAVKGAISWAGSVSGDWPNNAGNAKIASAIEQTVLKMYK